MITKTKREKKEFREQVFFSVFLAALTVGLIGFLVLSNFRISQKRSQLQNEIENLENEIKGLDQKNAELETGISKASQDSHWEEKVREQGYQKPGEQQVVVLPPQENNSSSAEKSRNFFQKILQKIGL